MQAERLGFGPRTPIYYDMEAFAPSQTGTALRFLSAWTTRLHTLGYSSGVYSSSSSGVAVLSQQYSGHKYAMPNVIYDACGTGSKNTSDSVFKPGQWANHQRVHQFQRQRCAAHSAATPSTSTRTSSNVNLPHAGRDTAGVARRDPAQRRHRRLLPGLGQQAVVRQVQPGLRLGRAAAAGQFGCLGPERGQSRPGPGRRVLPGAGRAPVADSPQVRRALVQAASSWR